MLPRHRLTYVACRERGALRTEATASIVCRLLADLDLCPPPCCWNIVPVRPYSSPDQTWSNRPPTNAEIAAGIDFARELIQLLQPTVIVAVGRCAKRGLTRAGIDHLAVRHPSQGGATQFRLQLARLINGHTGE